MPVRSTGCFTCRKRKIRCDETRPRCQRCIVHGVECPGYAIATVGHLEFRDQTSWAMRRVKDKHAKAVTTGSAVKEPKDDQKSNLSETATGEHDYYAAPESFQPSRGIIITRRSKSNHDFGEDTVANGPLSIETISSMSVMRSQLYAEFLNYYLPKHTPSDHFVFFQAIGQRSISDRALAEATDALSLVAVGAATSNDQLLRAAVSSYGRSLNRLACALRRQNAFKDDEILATVTILAQCEFYDEIKNSNETGWGSHVDGTQQLIAARGPESLTSDFALSMFSNARHGALIRALIVRKAPILAKPAWRKLLRSSAPLDVTVDFYDAALQIPGLLETYDCLDWNSPAALNELDALLWRLDQIQQRLQSWYSSWEAGILLREGAAICTLASIENFATFTALCSDRAFTSALMFHRFSTAYLATCYWQCMLALRKTVQSLLVTRPAFEDGWRPREEQIVHEEELAGYVTNLCQTIPYFCEPCCASSGQVGIFLPLATAALYAREHSNWTLLRWVCAVRTTVFVKGMSPPG